MFCKKCGAYMNDNQRYCSQCGAVIIGEEGNVSSVSSYVGPMGSTTPTLVFGILGLSFSCSFCLSILGIIFSIIGLCKANRAVDIIGNTSRKVNIGRRLAIAGLIVGIITTVLFVVYIAIMIRMMIG